MACASSKHALLALLLFCACEGSIGDVLGGSSDEDGEGSTRAGDPFALDREQPSLLPFNVRLRRVASVVGVSTDDPVLADLRANRIALGDYDHATGVAPDFRWGASRIALWARSLKPVCASSAMRERYPALPGDLPKLIGAAYGRETTAEDMQDYEGVLSEVGLGDSERYEALCMAVLSSAEFVLQ